jgi:hypothetical protein
VDTVEGGAGYQFGDLITIRARRHGGERNRKAEGRGL